MHLGVAAARPGEGQGARASGHLGIIQRLNVLKMGHFRRSMTTTTHRDDGFLLVALRGSRAQPPQW